MATSTVQYTQQGSPDCDPRAKFGTLRANKFGTEDLRFLIYNLAQRLSIYLCNSMGTYIEIFDLSITVTLKQLVFLINN